MTAEQSMPTAQGTTSTAEASNGPESQPDTKPTRQSRGKVKKVQGAVSVISGYRYYKKAAQRTARDLRLPYLRYGINYTKSELDSQRSAPGVVYVEDMDPSVINRSFWSHCFILGFVGLCGVLALLATAHGFGLLFRHGHWIPQGNYFFITGPLFLFYAVIRCFISWRSALFFHQARKTMNTTEGRPDNV